MDLMPIKILNTAIERILNKEMAELGITYTQATVIGFLNRNKDVEICQRNIEENLGLTHPTVSSILARLEEKKIIDTQQLESDKRFKRVFLTKKSIEMYKQIEEKISAISNCAFYGVTKEEQEHFSAVIQKVIQNVNK
ncbi:MAG: MarR family transcriptional regulator [Oscillospiraceae bacterium]|nr:MarR family transcriptional regulator [Oscillospiraceae bacterium]